MAPASTEAWRVSGFVTAGNSAIRDVCVAAWPRITNVSRHSIWLSRMPAPSKPAASMLRRSVISSGTGDVPGTRRCTRTGTVISRASETAGHVDGDARHEIRVVGREEADDPRLITRLGHAPE